MVTRKMNLDLDVVLCMSVNLKKEIRRGFMKMKRPIDKETNQCYTEINFSEVNLSIASKRG